MEVAQQQNFAQMIRHAHHNTLHLLLKLLAAQRLAWFRDISGHQVDELAPVAIAGIDVSLKRVGGPTRLAAHQVARLIGRNRKKPRPEPPRQVEAVTALVNLQERLLKDIFGGRAVAQEANEEVKQLSLVAFDERLEGGKFAVKIAFE